MGEMCQEGGCEPELELPNISNPGQSKQREFSQTSPSLFSSEHLRAICINKNVQNFLFWETMIESKRKIEQAKEKMETT